MTILPSRTVAAALFSATLASAQLSTIGPFAGDVQEGFETQQNSTFDPCVVGPVFGGLADLCANPGQIAASWSSTCFADDHSGDYFYGTQGGSLEFSFSAPVQRFGGYFANNLFANVLTVAFFDAQDDLIDRVDIDGPNDCTWRWNGWQLTEPAYFIRIVPDVPMSTADGRVLLDDLELDLFPAGTNYCVTSVNSTGFAASMSMLGSASVAANDLILRAGPIPTGEPGIFYYGQNEVQQPFGDGFRCVGGMTLRLFPVAFANSTGFLSYLVNYNTLPPSGSVLPGSIWKFQAWFRDAAAAGSGFNLSDGFSIAFTP